MNLAFTHVLTQNQMAVALGGRVAEEIRWRRRSDNRSINDLQQVANVARQMITKFGMSDKIGPVALGQSQGGMLLKRYELYKRLF